MATIQKPLTQRVVRKSMTGALVVLALAGASSGHATSSNQPPGVGPQVPPPQGILTVYSERYVMEDADVPVLYRRPVALYTSEGHLVGTYTNPVGDGPIRIAIPPGHYLVVSESHWTQRKVQVNVEDRQETVVPEGLLE
jgi:hypothetical protein